MPERILDTFRRVAEPLRRAPAGDVFWLAGAALVSAGAAIERLSAGLIVAGLLLLVLGVGSVTRAR